MARTPRAGRDSDLVAAVDLGASKAACIVALLVDGPDGEKFPEIVGVGLQGLGAERAGPARTPAGEPALRAAVDAAERMAGERLRSIAVAVAGRRLAARRIGVDLDLDTGRVTREDIADCAAEGAAAAAGEGRRSLHASVVGYALDGEPVGADPCGLAGATLTAALLGVGAAEAHLANLETLAERCGLAIESFAAGPLAAAEAALIEDEKELGAVLIDIGAASTGYAVFEGGAAVDCGGVGLGGDHITRDVAQIFGASLREAERVKTLYGSALSGPADEHRLVEFPQLGGEEILRAPRAELSAVIAPRLEEILELVAERLPTSARARGGVRRVVLTGGGSLLVGARESAERVLQMKARLGRPAALSGAPEIATGPQFSVCAGMILLAARERSRSDARAPAIVRSVRPARAGGGLIAGVGRWMRDKW